MNHDILPRFPRTSSAPGVPWRLRRETTALAQRDAMQAALRAFRLSLVAEIARTGMANTEMLSELEIANVMTAPHSEGRQRAIVDAYALLVASEITALRGGF